MSPRQRKEETVSETPEPVEEKRGRGRPRVLSKEHLEMLKMGSGSTDRQAQNFYYEGKARNLLEAAGLDVDEKIGARDVLGGRIMTELGRMLVVPWDEENLVSWAQWAVEQRKGGSTVAEVADELRRVRREA